LKTVVEAEKVRLDMKALVCKNVTKVKFGMKWFSMFLIICLAGCATTPTFYNYQLKLVEPVESDTLKYGDKNINISFSIKPNNVSLTILNKLNKPITLLYERAVYVDQFNLAHNTTHFTLSLLTNEVHSSPRVIPPKTILCNYFAPVDNIESVSEWRTFGLVEPFVRTHPEFEATIGLKTLDRKAKSNIGKRIGISLPIEVDGKVEDYFFKFEITDVHFLKQKKMEYVYYIVGGVALVALLTETWIIIQ